MMCFEPKGLIDFYMGSGTIDLIKEIGSSRNYTLHSHTEFCDGRAQMEAFAREAVRHGFTHYGFTPHSPVPIQSPCNITRAHVDDYDREYRRISAEYGDRCKFYRGMEIDYLSDDWGPSHPYFESLGLDFGIGSVHFIPSIEGTPIDIDGRFESFKRKMSNHFNNDIRYVVEKFYEHSIKMVEAGGFDIIGHLDKIGYNASMYAPGIESESWYQALLSELVDKVIDAGIIVEINTKAYDSSGRMFPAVSHWERLVENKVPLLVNSDAHVPALINAGREKAFEMLDAIANKIQK